jgi:hypothetical protein
MIHPSSTTTRLLLTLNEDRNEDLVRATLPPPLHPRAAHTMLTGLSLWLGQPLSVVLDAGEAASSFALNLYDDFGFGAVTPHYQVEIVEPGRRRRGDKARDERGPRQRRGVR